MYEDGCSAVSGQSYEDDKSKEETGEDEAAGEDTLTSPLRKWEEALAQKLLAAGQVSSPFLPKKNSSFHRCHRHPHRGRKCLRVLRLNQMHMD